VPPPKKLPASAALLADPELRRRIRATIGGKVPKQDVEDVMQQVYLRLVGLLDRLPAEPNERIALAVTITQGRAIDYQRHRLVHDGRREEVEEMEDLPAETHAISPETRAGWNQMLALIDAEIAAGNIPPEALRWAHGLAQGKTIAEMAREDGVTESKIKMVLKRAREVLGPRWKEISGIGLSTLGIVLIWIFVIRNPPEPEIGPDVHAFGRSRATSSAAASSAPVPHESPSALRDLARQECAALDYSTCAMDLDRARELDPDGEKLPEVIAMRKTLHDVMNGGGKKP
jgi:DNA-directed RNA polymerase specialized sigma24 family protein